VGVREIQSTTNKDATFEGLDTYLEIARKMVVKYAPAHLKNDMLRDEDVISYVAYSIMRADWQYDGRGHKAGFRSQMAQFAIKSYQNRRMKSRSRRGGVSICSLSSSFDGLDDSPNLSDSMVDDTPQPGETVELKELFDRVDLLLEGGMLSDRQASCIKLFYYDDFSMQEIATKIGVTRQYVHKCIVSGIEILQQDPVFKNLIQERVT
jgi:RNA polymerase sigma factor (sigma-70 family)